MLLCIQICKPVRPQRIPCLLITRNFIIALLTAIMSIPLFQEIDENSKNLDFLILYLENYFSPKAKPVLQRQFSIFPIYIVINHRFK